jgi:hypothetical protein
MFLFYHLGFSLLAAFMFALCEPREFHNSIIPSLFFSLIGEPHVLCISISFSLAFAGIGVRAWKKRGLRP